MRITNRFLKKTTPGDKHAEFLFARGLSISYGIVKDYDGVIMVKTQEGNGTVFTVQFPVAEKA